MNSQYGKPIKNALLGVKAAKTILYAMRLLLLNMVIWRKTVAYIPYFKGSRVEILTTDGSYSQAFFLNRFYVTSRK